MNLKILSFLFIIILFTSCEKYIGEDINADPNASLTVPVNAQLPAIQIALADLHGGEFSRQSSLLIQQIEGVARSYFSFNQYTGLTPNRFNTSWRIVYEDILNEINLAKKTALAQEFHHYIGVLNVLEAYTLMMATDVWDDMPYTDALKGFDNINPIYDSQLDIYETIYQLLDEALLLFDGPAGLFNPSDDDVFNKGDIDLWVKTAHAIKARGLLHYKDYEGAMTEAIAAFTSSNQNLSFQYPDANSAANWYRFNRDRTGDIEFHPTMRNLLNSLNDSLRLAVMDQVFTTNHTYLKPDFNEELITYREMQFIIAETDVRLNSGGTQLAYDALLNGIKASFDRLGLDQQAYDSYVNQENFIPSPGELTLEFIMTQKYIAMFLQAEAYTDWRRTKFPQLTPISGTTIPVRWHYSSDEYQFNSNAPALTSINIFEDKVGWNR